VGAATGAVPDLYDLPLQGVGRYVRVQLTQPNYLSLAEVQVFGTAQAPTNVAAGKSATQSSNYNSDTLAALAVDGNTNGDFAAGSVTHTLGETAPWWQVDLGAQYSVSQVKLYNRTDCCGERLQNFYVFVSAQPFSSTDPAQTAAEPGVVSTFVGAATGAVPELYDLPLQGVGRYVRVQLTQPNYLSLAEVQVFGTPQNVPPAPANVAAGKSATQSSNYNSATLAALALDGNTNGDFAAGSVTHTLGEAAPWWQVDLGDQYPVSQVKLYNRTDCCRDRLQNFYVFLSPEPFSSTDPGVTAAQPGVISLFIGAASGEVPARYDLPLVGVGRYVRVQLANADYLSLAEVQVLVPQ
jgi:hypothetical protein